MKYPNSKQKANYYTLHNQNIEDNYAWMEESSDNLAKWINEQNELTQEIISKSTKRNTILKRIKELSNYERKSLYREVGEYLIYSKNSGLEDLPKIFKRNKHTKEEEIFLDPNTLSEDATSPIVSLSFSKDNKYCAYGIAKAGADWVEVKVIEVETQKILKDHIIGVKFDSDVFSRGVSFYKNGFFYPKYTTEGKEVDYTQKDIPGMLYYHELGTSQEEDILIYEEKNIENLILGSFISPDEKYLVIPTSTGCTGNNLYVTELNLNSNMNALSFKEIISGYDNKNEVVGFDEEHIFILTNSNAKNRKIVSYFLENNNQKDIIVESSIPIESAKIVFNKLCVETLENVQSKITFYTLYGELIKEIPMPNLGTFLGLSGSTESKKGYFAVSSFLSPSQVFSINFETLDYGLYESAKVNFDFENYEVKQEFTKSTDGKLVPMFIVKKKGLELKSDTPTILYGYGGFNISLLPVFSPKILSWIELGGVFVMANLRGGGEYGEVWHEAGKKHKKQQVFDDAHACAQYLIDKKYCTRNTLAIQGGSNGGLLAAVCALQRPDLYKVSLPAAGVLDMLKYHKFTCGYQWSDEYGVAENEEDFKVLYSYSPLHIIDKNKEYPAFLVTCADLDDRVVPAHSFKFVAALQQAKGVNPYLIRIETNSSHGASNLSKYLEESADTLAFILMNFKK